MITSEAWRTIGEAFEKYAATGKTTQLSCYGICSAMQQLGFDDYGSPELDKRLDGHYMYHTTFGQPGPDTANERALFCYLMAEAE